MDVEGSRAHTQAAVCARSVSVLWDLFSGTSICNRLSLIGTSLFDFWWFCYDMYNSPCYLFSLLLCARPLGT